MRSAQRVTLVVFESVVESFPIDIPGMPNEKKIVTPAATRSVVVKFAQSYEVSQWKAHEVTGLERSAVRYRGVRPEDTVNCLQLSELASDRRRFG